MQKLDVLSYVNEQYDIIKNSKNLSRFKSSGKAFEIYQVKDSRDTENPSDKYVMNKIKKCDSIGIPLRLNKLYYTPTYKQKKGDGFYMGNKTVITNLNKTIQICIEV